jgi:hypothetical protein
MSLQAEQQKVSAMDEAKWALLPQPPEFLFTEDTNVTGVLQGIRIPYPVRHQPLYLPNALLLEDLRENWRPVADFGAYRLYRHVRLHAGG